MPVKLRSQGFSLLGVIIIIASVALVGLGGWYVWHKNQKDPQTATNNDQVSQEPDTTNSATSADSKTDTTKPAADSYAGWKTYTYDGGAFSFKYPSVWTVTDQTSNTNSYVSIWLESPAKPYGSVILTFDVIKESFVSQYDVEGSVQTLGNKLRLWTKQMQWTSKGYNNFQPFDCARLRILDTGKNQEVKLPGNRYLSGEGGFCINENSYTTKSYTEQLDSAEIKDAIKIYESILVGN